MTIGLQAQRDRDVIRKAGQAETSDAKALAILDKVKAKYASYSTMQFDAVLTIKDGDYTESQKGTVSVKGKDKFKLETKDQDIYVNGETVWTHIKAVKEVQISDFDEEGMGMFGSPDKLLENYAKDFIVSPAVSTTANGKKAYLIECKPKDRNSEYSKARIVIDQATNRLVSIKVFDKSNIHYTIAINKFSANPSLNDAYFKLNTAGIPKENIIDMRF